MKLNILATVPAGLLLSALIGCSAAPSEEGTAASESQDLTACPVRSAQDDQMRAAATVAFNLMKDASSQTGTQASSILAPHRYRLQSSGVAIEFDPTDPYYPVVTDAMKAHLAFAQADASVAKFMADGLKYAYANTDGQVFPMIMTVPALRTYRYPGPVTVAIADPTTNTNSHRATVTGQAWCGTSVVTIADTVNNSWQYSPMQAGAVTMWRSVPGPSFKGTKRMPWTPFNGSVSSGNPYLIVSVNGKATNWATYNFTPVSCYEFANMTCTGSIEIDPVPYAEPGEYYVTQGLLGTQANPFALSSTVLYATPDHASQWATRTVNGVQEWGVFATPVTFFGTTMYRYSKRF